MYRGSYGQPVSPVFGGHRGYQAEVLFYPLVLPFGQSIRLRVEGCGHVLLGLQFISKRLAKVGCELGVPVADDFCW